MHIIFICIHPSGGTGVLIKTSELSGVSPSKNKPLTIKNEGGVRICHLWKPDYTKKGLSSSSLRR